MNGSRLTDDELDALLEAHVACSREHCICKGGVCDCCTKPWPCETVRLATEVKELRALKDAARILETVMAEVTELENLVWGGKAEDPLLALRDALAHYEEGGR